MHSWIAFKRETNAGMNKRLSNSQSILDRWWIAFWIVLSYIIKCPKSSQNWTTIADLFQTRSYMKVLTKFLPVMSSIPAAAEAKLTPWSTSSPEASEYAGVRGSPSCSAAYILWHQNIYVINLPTTHHQNEYQ